MLRRVTVCQFCQAPVFGTITLPVTDKITQLVLVRPRIRKNGGRVGVLSLVTIIGVFVVVKPDDCSFSALLESHPA